MAKTDHLAIGKVSNRDSALAVEMFCMLVAPSVRKLSFYLHPVAAESVSYLVFLCSCNNFLA
jgi:hypothetical protein